MSRRRAPYLFLCPELRSSIIEESPPDLPAGSIVLYLRSKANFHPPRFDDTVCFQRVSLMKVLFQISSNCRTRRGNSALVHE
jgi:hypothetical protein